MNEISKHIQGAFAKNRAEELGYDVWEHFVVPPFLEKLDLTSGKKPRVIIGGRGCGKTMLLRYLSHQSTFSKKRDIVPLDSLSHIGLYWRADTQFSRTMFGRGLDLELWSSAFEHFLAITFALQVAKSIRSISLSKLDGARDISLDRIAIDKLKAYNPIFIGNLELLEALLESQIFEFEMWVTNTKKVPEPLFLPGFKFVKSLISIIREQVSRLSNAVYFAYIDEYENLHEHQKRIVNTFVKHSEDPLILNIATKRNGMKTRSTVGEECIMDIADYKMHDLEQYILDDGFEEFAAEVLSLTLAVASPDNRPEEVQRLRDISMLEERMRSRPALLRRMHAIFPEHSHHELAVAVLITPGLRGKLRRLIESALRKRISAITPDKFIVNDLPEASIVSAALLNRATIYPEDVLREFEALGSGEDNRFSGETNWIHNNLIGCLLWIYESYSKPCPFYAGFSAFCHLSRGNLRHFLELCNNSVKHSQQRNAIELQPISVEHQAQAARQTSAAFLGEIKSFGKLGNILHVFVLRLGGLLSLAHRRPTQSEPEQCQFTVVGGQSEIPERIADFLSEAIKWSVLFVGKETKVKGQISQRGYEYVLNPIYAPYFQITYRKKRNLELNIAEFTALVSGELNEYLTLLKQFGETWSVEIGAGTPTIFTNLFEAEQ